MLEDHKALMERMNTWNFQIFDLVDKTGGKTGRILSYVSTTNTSVVSFHLKTVYFKLSVSLKDYKQSSLIKTRPYQDL